MQFRLIYLKTLSLSNIFIDSLFRWDNGTGNSGQFIRRFASAIIGVRNQVDYKTARSYMCSSE